MGPLRTLLFALGLLVTAAWTSPPARSTDQAGSKTVVGQSNSLLAEGAAALEAGRIEEGVRLTLEGLKIAVTARENAAGHSNVALAPGAPTLHESIRILERNKRLVGRQARKVVPS